MYTNIHSVLTKLSSGVMHLPLKYWQETRRLLKICEQKYFILFYIKYINNLFEKQMTTNVGIQIFSYFVCTCVLFHFLQEIKIYICNLSVCLVCFCFYS